MIFGQDYEAYAPPAWMDDSASYTTDFISPTEAATSQARYNLATNIVQGLTSITRSIFGVVAAAQTPGPGAPAPVVQPYGIPMPGITPATVAMIGIPAAILGVVLLSRGRKR